ncbi:MAG: iron ABC transporter substrate-binding protein, partial [Dermatophilaceae bacterium]|nr:iron ABC transporter substrate-binding protein [Dermatophilaceae bacterium]
LAFVTSKEGQGILASSDAKEYAVGSGVESDPALPKLASLEAPPVDPYKLNGPEVISMMTEAGIL